jgi:hypothetical protein
MPRIFDNFGEETQLVTALTKTLKNAYRADFCVGYFNLRGWRELADYIDEWDGGDDHAVGRSLECRDVLPCKMYATATV